jgi:hypothetical protein
MPHEPTERLISEPIRPLAGSFDTAMMSRGSPGLPRRFTWRGRMYEVAALLETRKTLGPCTSGSGEMYVRRHWFTVRTATGETMTLYFDRQTRRGQPPKVRWWLFSIAD